jgi:hemerythrin-like metal-binding protein
MDSTRDALNSVCTEAVDVIGHGVLWLDSELNIQGCNRALRQLLELDDAPAFFGRPYGEFLDFLAQRGEFFGDEYERDFVPAMQNHPHDVEAQIERVRPNRIALLVKVRPLTSGGFIHTYQDVTQERNARESQRRNAKATVVTMANFAEHRDTDTGVHVLRVARLVGQTARKLMHHPRFAGVIDETYIEHLATAAILHDVGKISTPDRILLKSGVLTQEERDVMKRHTFDGANLLNQAKLTMGQSQYLDIGIDVALNHHEWYDGRGYPQGLAGDDIPLAGRICAVADVFDALTSRRPYKQPWDTAKALDLLQTQSGSQFDPDVVTAFIEVIREREAVCLVRWTDALSVGDQHIDEQHSILLDTINQLASAESLHNHHAVSMIIDELASYAVFHFDYEEKLMASHRYPHLDEHRVIHQVFARWVGDLREEYAIFGKRPLGQPVLDFLRDWLSHHILGEDQRYRPYLLQS